MTDDLIQYIFKASPELKDLIGKAIQGMPQISNRSEFIRQAIYQYAATGPLQSDPSLADGDLKNLIELLSQLLAEHEGRMYQRISSIHSQLADLHYFIKQRSSSDEVEIANYLDMITKALFEDHLESTLKVSIANRLIPLLEHEFHGDYLGEWIHLQQERKLLSIHRDKIIWNEDNIRRIYDEGS